MRRERREKSRGVRFFYIVGILILILSITLVISYRIYNNRLSKISESMLSSQKVIGLVPNTSEENDKSLESASSSLSKTIEEANKEMEKKEGIDIENETLPTIETETKEEARPVQKKELSFVYPVAGEIVKGFSMDNLLYSETLEEWTTHQGIDIKADRTTVVTAAEDGVVAAIKNDPRYGLTVIVEHEDGFKTIYSNLLTTEFVIEDEKVTKGQSLGTVGNSAVFEIADEPHLHFEMIKDGEYVNPELYIK